MSNADILLKAFENDDNNFILNHTTEKIEKSKRELFEELNLNKEDVDDLMKKLEDYIYISEIPEIVLRPIGRHAGILVIRYQYR